MMGHHVGIFGTELAYEVGTEGVGYGEYSVGFEALACCSCCGDFL